MEIMPRNKVGKEYIKALLDNDVVSGSQLTDSKTLTKFLEGRRSSKSDTSISFSKTVHELRTDTQRRIERYRDYDRALQDSIIGQAVEMMADDATQFDVDRTKTVWVEGKNKEYVTALNSVIKKYIEPFIDSIATGIVGRGEFYFQVDEDDTLVEIKGSKTYKFRPLLPLKYIANLHHLIMQGGKEFFYVTEDTSNAADTLHEDDARGFKPEWDYLHFINTSLDNSEELYVEVRNKDKVKREKIFSLQGVSIITDKVLETWRILKSLEDALIVTRMSKSKFVRIISVDVTRVSDDETAANIVDYIHSNVVENENISPSAGSYWADQTQAEPVIITIPVSDGVGSVTLDEFVSDVNIRDIADMDYFLNKLFAGLRTPKAYFDYGEMLPGTGNQGSLVRSDIRYSRAVKKTQRCIVNGVYQLVDMFNHFNKIDVEKEGEKYAVTVHILKTTSAEDEERMMELDSRVALANNVIDMIYTPEEGIDMKKLKLVEKFFKDVAPMDEMVNYLDDISKGVAIASKPDGVKLKEE